MSTPLDLATDITSAPTGMEGSGVTTTTNYTYSYRGSAYVCDDANSFG